MKILFIMNVLYRKKEEMSRNIVFCLGIFKGRELALPWINRGAFRKPFTAVLIKS